MPLIRLSLFVLPAAVLLGTQWTSGVSSDWNNNANWTPATFPNSNADSASFDAPAVIGSITVALGAGMQDITVNSIDFPSSAGSFTSYTITAGGVASNTLILDGSPAVVSYSNANGTQTIACPVSCAGAVTLQNTNTATALTLSGNISGPGSLTKQGSSQVTLSGNNTYGGGTTVAAGLLLVTSASLSGNTVLSGSARLYFDSTTGGTYAGNITGTGNEVAITGAGVITLSGNNTYSTATSIYAGTLRLGSGTALAGTSILLINDTLDLNGFNVTLPFVGGDPTGKITNQAAATTATITFNTTVPANGLFPVIMDGAGTVAVEKTGGGVFFLLGANTYTGGTLVSAGALSGNATSLQGDIVNNSQVFFDEGSSVTGTYAGDMSGNGDLTKQGAGTLIMTGLNTYTGLTTVSAGNLAVNGSLSGGGSLLVSSGATLQGTGTITKDCTINGMLSPGNSIGTINLVGTQVMTTGSTLNIELNPTTSDLVNVTGTFTIQPGVTLNIIPDFGVYTPPLSYLIVHTTGGVSGMFTTVTSPLPLFNLSNIIETIDDVLIMINSGFMPFTDFFNTGNAGAVARCLDALNGSSCCDFSTVIATLHFIPSIKDLKHALLQLQPSLYTDFALAQEDNTLYIQNTIDHRLDDKTHSTCKDENSVTVWGTFLGGHTSQRGTDSAPGFVANTPGSFIGLDSTLGKSSCAGGGVGYTYTNLNWRDMPRSNGHTQTVYVAAYGKWGSSRLSLYTTLLGGYNFYSAHRKMRFGDVAPIRLTARSTHQGAQGSIHVKTGYKALDKRHAALTPFVSVDYLFLHETGFREKGAQCLNLKINPHNSDLLIGEAGLDWTAPFQSGCHQYAPFIKLSAVQEIRFLGKKERGSFNCGCSMTVKGQRPERTLGNIEAGFSGSLFSHDDLRVAFQTRFGHNYRNCSGYLEYNYHF